MGKIKCEIVKAIMKYRPMSRKLCLACKGSRLLCHRPKCPLLTKINIQSSFERKLREEIFGPSPSIFVGHSGYPNVFVGPLTAIEDEKADILDDPSKWYGLDLEDIVKLRSMLVRGKTRKNVKKMDKIVEKNQEVALSIKPVDTEVKFAKKPKYSLTFSPVSQPLGASGIIEKFDVAENPKIPKRVDNLLEDKVKANEAVVELYERGYDVYYISRAFSSGAFGIEKRLVPTRWSITAVDDIVGKHVISKIKKYSEVNEYMVFHNTYLYNHFEILLIPSKWQFEMFEAWAPNTIWTLAYTKPAINVEREGFFGRTTYAESEAGAYYAARLAVAEALEKMKKQASVVVFREIYEGYIIPVGVWEIRENVRKAMEKKPRKFQTLKEALEDIKTRLKIPLEVYLKRSSPLNQTKLEWFL